MEASVMDELLPIVVTYEDREDALAGVEILARSLHTHSPDLTFHIYTPHVHLARRLCDLPNAKIIARHDLIGQGWNIKPTVLLATLENHESALWLDSDIVVSANIIPKIQSIQPDALLISQDFKMVDTFGGRLRADAYGLAFGQLVRFGVNSGTVMVSRFHVALLNRWAELLGQDDYQAQQKRPRHQRELAFFGDQDALWAALASQQSADLMIEYFETGKDMVLHSGANGYSVGDRLRSLMRPPPLFTHMLGAYKPWSFPNSGLSKDAYFHLVCYELSPYFEAARVYADKIPEASFLKRRTRFAKILNGLFFGNIALRGLPLAIVAQLAEKAKNRR
jgi:hypothetical protein